MLTKTERPGERTGGQIEPFAEIQAQQGRLAARPGYGAADARSARTSAVKPLRNTCAGNARTAIGHGQEAAVGLQERARDGDVEAGPGGEDDRRDNADHNGDKGDPRGLPPARANASRTAALFGRRHRRLPVLFVAQPGRCLLPRRRHNRATHRTRPGRSRRPAASWCRAVRRRRRPRRSHGVAPVGDVQHRLGRMVLIGARHFEMVGRHGAPAARRRCVPAGRADNRSSARQGGGCRP